MENTQVKTLDDFDFSEWEAKDAEVQSNAWGRLVPEFTTAPVRPLDLEFEHEYTIGRGEDMSVTIPDKYVSTSHCKLFHQNGVSWVVDTSLCGTFLNDERLAKGERRRIEPGDTLALVTPRSKSDRGHTFVFVEAAKRTEQICQGEINKHYEIMDALGSGACATVHKGVHKESGKLVAVKILRKSNFQLEQHAWEMQLQEANTLQKLDHPNVIKLVDLYKNGDEIYIVTELAEGGELFHRIVKNGPYSEPRAKLLIKRILEAVAYLHSMGIVHRDLKPENILMASSDDDLDIRLADFGVAKAVDAGCKTVTGSISYIAPEVLNRKNTVKGIGRYNEGADMWSVGVVVYIVLSGLMPFSEGKQKNMEMFQALQDLLEFKPKEWQSISKDAKDFLKAIFTTDTKARLTALQALDHVWLKDMGGKQPPVSETVTNNDKTTDEGEAVCANKRKRTEEYNETPTPVPVSPVTPVNKRPRRSARNTK